MNMTLTVLHILYLYNYIATYYLPDCVSGCAGKGKGRSYPAMTTEEQQWLTAYYAPYNTRLRQLLTELGRTPPRWLVNSALLD